MWAHVTLFTGVGLGVYSLQAIILSLAYTVALVSSSHCNIYNQHNMEEIFWGKWTHSQFYKNSMISSTGHFVHVLSIFMDFASFIVLIYSFWLLHLIQIYNMFSHFTVLNVDSLK